jgi:hypothetical protein
MYRIAASFDYELDGLGYQTALDSASSSSATMSETCFSTYPAAIS